MEKSSNSSSTNSTTSDGFSYRAIFCRRLGAAAAGDGVSKGKQTVGAQSGTSKPKDPLSPDETIFDDGPFFCPKCGDQFWTRQGLNGHQNVHRRAERLLAARPTTSSTEKGIPLADAPKFIEDPPVESYDQVLQPAGHDHDQKGLPIWFDPVKPLPVAEELAAGSGPQSLMVTVAGLVAAELSGVFKGKEEQLPVSPLNPLVVAEGAGLVAAELSGVFKGQKQQDEWNAEMFDKEMKIWLSLKVDDGAAEDLVAPAATSTDAGARAEAAAGGDLAGAHLADVDASWLKL